MKVLPKIVVCYDKGVILAKFGLKLRGTYCPAKGTIELIQITSTFVKLHTITHEIIHAIIYKFGFKEQYSFLHVLLDKLALLFDKGLR